MCDELGPPLLGCRTILPEQILPEQTTPVPATRAEEKASEPVGGDTGQVIWEYSEARRRLGGLVQEAREVGERLERLGQALSRHPGRLIVGLPDSSLVDPGEWDIVPGHPLPSVDRLVALTKQIREIGANVEELRERLILMGRADVVEEPDGFFR
jgi:hypothetical protein